MKKLFLLIAIAFCFQSQGQKVIFNKGFETGDKFQDALFLPFSLPATAYAAEISTNYAATGTKSIRIELRASDPSPVAAGSSRSELYISKDRLPGYDFWVSFTEYMTSDYAYDARPEIHAQMHTSDKDRVGSPLWGLWVEADKWKLVQAFDTLDTGTQTIISYDLGDVIKGEWVQWVFHNKFEVNSTGLIEVWRNGVKVLNIEGANFNGDGLGGRETKPIFKFGIYKWQWKSQPGPFNPSTRVMYYDDIILMDEGATIEDFTTPDPPIQTDGITRVPLAGVVFLNKP